MAENLGTAVLTLKTDASGFQKGLDNAQSRASRFQDKMKSFGKTASAAITVPMAAAGTAAVKAASDLQESMNAVNVVFEESAKTIEDWGKTSAQAAGITTAEFNEAAATLGSVLQNAGLSAEAAAEKTIQLTQRAADMASVFNTDVDQALDAIKAGLRGEIDPLERFGVTLNAAAVEAEAVAEGIANAGGELSAQQKTVARMSAIMEQTSRVAGDFADTSDNLANKWRVLRSRATNMAARFGKQLLPVFEKLLDIGSKVLNFISNLSPTMKKLGAVVLGLVGAAGPLALLISSFSTIVGVLSGPAGLVALIGGAVAGLVALAEKARRASSDMQQLKESANQVRAVVKGDGGKLTFAEGAFEGQADEFGGGMQQIAREAKASERAVNELMNSLNIGPEALMGSIPPYQKVLGKLNEEWDLINKKARVLGWDRLKVVNERIQAMQSAITDALEKGVDPTNSAFQKLVEQLDAAKGRAKSLKDEMKDVAKETGRAMPASIGEITERFDRTSRAPARSPAFNLGGGGGGMTGAIRTDRGGFGALGDRLVGVFRKLDMSKVGDAIGGALKGALSGALGFLSSMFQKAELFSQTLGSLTDDIVRSLQPAIKLLSRLLSSISPVLKFLGRIVSNALVPVFKVLGQILQRLTPIFRLVGALLQAVGGILKAITPALMAVFRIVKAALVPILQILTTVLKVLTPILQIVSAVFKALAPVIEILFLPLKALGEALVWLHDNVFVPVGNFIMDIFENVANFFINVMRKVVKGLNKIPFVDINKPSRVSFDRMQKIGSVGGDVDFSGVGDVNTSDLEATKTGEGTGGTTGSIQQARPITVNVDIYDNEIAGDGSFRDLALQIRRELEAIEAINA